MKPKSEQLLLLLFLAGVFLAGCAQKNSPVGSNLAPGLNDALPREMFLPPQNIRFYRTSVNTGSSSLLYLGHNQDYYANILLRFNPAGSLPDSFLMDSLRVKLILDSVLVPGTSPMAASAFLVNMQQPWIETGGPGVTWDNFNTDSLQLGSSFAALQIPPAAVDSDSVIFTLPSPDSLIRAWKSAGSGGKTLDFNNGIYLIAAQDQNYMLRFVSGDNYLLPAHRPLLEMFLRDYDTTVTHGGDPVDTMLLIGPSGDAFIAKDSTALTPADSAFIYLGNGAAYRTLISFNIDSAFTAHYGLAVQRAEVILHSDTTNALAFDHVSGAVGLPLADLNWLQTPATETTTPVSLPLISLYTSTTGILAVDVTSIVNGWVIHSGTNNGLMIHSANEYFNIARLPFWGPSAPADSLKPVLRIVYVNGGAGQ